MLFLGMIMSCCLLAHATYVRYACPHRSWCLPVSLCPQTESLEVESSLFACGHTASSRGHVCCSSQRLLDVKFEPSPSRWYFTDEKTFPVGEADDVVVLPWPDNDPHQDVPASQIGGHHTNDNAEHQEFEYLEESTGEPVDMDSNVFSHQNDINENDDDSAAAETRSLDEDREVADEEHQSSSEEDNSIDVQDVCGGQVCPARSLCVPWIMCSPSEVAADYSDDQSEYLCGHTTDTVNSVCCQSSRLVHSMMTMDSNIHTVDGPFATPETTKLSSSDTPPVTPYSLQQLAAAYNSFSPPVPAPRPSEDSNKDKDRRATLLEQVLYGKSKVIGGIRSRRDLSSLVQRAGSVLLGDLDDSSDAHFSGDNLLSSSPVYAINDDDKKVDHKDGALKTSAKPSNNDEIGGEHLPIQTKTDRFATSTDQVVDALTHEVVTPAKAPILSERSKIDGDINGRSTLGAFLDKLLDVSPVKTTPGLKPTKHSHKNTPAHASGENHEHNPNGESSRHHQRPSFFPNHHDSSHRPAGVSGIFNRPASAHRPHRVFPHLNHQHSGSSHFQQTRPRPPLEPPFPSSNHEHLNSPSNHILPTKCGQPTSLNIHARITGGGHSDAGAGGAGPARYGQFPWHVALLHATDLRYQCAGVLIAARVVLTVAHCVASQPARHPRLLARVGDWDLANKNEPYPAYDVPITSIIVHPDFHAGSLTHDIALLVLTTAVTELPHVQPACLPGPSPAVTLVGRRCTVAGWGQARRVPAHHHDRSSYSWRLRAAELRVLSAGSCEQQLRATQLGSLFRLARRGVLCAAGSDGADACFGDGGGGLVCRLPNEHGHSAYHVIGLVSWGVGCGHHAPGVYTRVGDYHHWIVGQLHHLSLHHSSSPPIHHHARQQNDKQTTSYTH